MKTRNGTIRLRAGPDALVRQGHPWIFARAIAERSRAGACGSVVEVLDSNGAWIARGLLNPDAVLAVRVLTRNPDEPVDEQLFRRRIEAAVALRRELFGADVNAEDTDAYRLVYSEADGLSGLVVDRYADVLSVQVRAGVWAPHLETVIAHLKSCAGLDRVHLAADAAHAVREGLDVSGLASLAETVAGTVTVRESGFAYDVHLGEGHKTGFYLDQRVNRRRAGAYARGRRLFSAYCYTGAFELHAARAGAREILGVDCSAPALEQAQRHHVLNATAGEHIRYERGDVPRVMRGFRDARRAFDMIVLDPPRFVVSRAQKQKGLRAYKDINLFAMKLLAPGGILATFSCSGLVTAEDFLTAVEWAARDAERDVNVLEVLGQPPDHPLLLGVPETAYLKGLICRVR